MAGIDPTSQKSGGGAGFRFDYGKVTWVAGESTVEVPTTLTQVFAAFGGMVVSEPNNSIMACSDGTVTNGAVTFTRPAMYQADAPEMWYVMFGF